MPKKANPGNQSPATSHQSPPIPDPDRKRYARAADVIVDDGFNARTDWGDLEGLALSIAEKGICDVGECWEDDERRPHLTDGERRLKGLRLCIERGWLTEDDPRALFPYLPGTRDTAERRERMLILNSGKPFTFLEKARTYAQIVTGEGQFTMEAVAKRQGISPTQVRNYLDFFILVATEVQQAAERGECTSTLALDLAHAIPDKAEQWEVYQEGRKYALDGQDPATAEVHVTARHLSVPTGKSPGRYGGPKTLNAGVPFQDVKSDSETGNPFGGTTHDLRMGTHDKYEIHFPRQSAAHGAVLIGTIRLGEEETGRTGEDASSPSRQVSESPSLSYRVGIEARWPAMRKEDGRLRELPRVNDKAHQRISDALLDGLHQLRGEIEAKDFNDTKKIAGAERRKLATDHLTRFIEKFTELTAGGFGAPLAFQLSAAAAKAGCSQDSVSPDANSGTGSELSSSSGSEGHDEQSEDSDSEEQETPPQPKASAKIQHPNHGVTASEVLNDIQETMAALGKETDQAACSLAAYIANACLGRYSRPDMAKTLRLLLSK